MEQIRVEFPERKLTMAEESRDIILVVSATLDILFFDGKRWFAHTANYEIPIYKQIINIADISKTKSVAERHVWHWFLKTMQDGEIEINGEMVKIYGVAAEPIYEEIEV